MGTFDGACAFQQRSSDLFYIIGRSGTNLYGWYGSPGNWRTPALLSSTVSGNPSCVQGRFGANGHFEVIAPSASGGLSYFWLNRDLATPLWSEFKVLGGAGQFDGAALIHGNLGPAPGNLELIARQGTRLVHAWRESRDAFVTVHIGGTGSEARWAGPLAVTNGVENAGSTWIVTAESQWGGYRIYRYNGSTWDYMAAAGTSIDVGPDGRASFTNEYGQLYRWLGDRWEQMSMSAKDVGVGGAL